MMPPIVKMNGFSYWRTPTGYAAAITCDGVQLYARDYKNQEPDDGRLVEPTPHELVALLLAQEVELNG